MWGVPNPRNSQIGLQKVKNYPEIKSKSNVRIEGNIENESCSITLVDHKIVFGPFPDPPKSPFGHQKVKLTPKLSQNQMSELKETKKMKVFQLHE